MSKENKCTKQRGDILKVSITTEGGFDKTESWLESLTRKVKSGSVLDGIDAMGVKALSSATPVGDTGETAAGWQAKKNNVGSGVEIAFYNNAHPEESVNIAKIIHFGHGTGTGGYVPPRPYINDAMAPVWAELDRRIDKELS